MLTLIRKFDLKKSGYVSCSIGIIMEDGLYEHYRKVQEVFY